MSRAKRSRSPTLLHIARRGSEPIFALDSQAQSRSGLPAALVLTPERRVPPLVHSSSTSSHWASASASPSSTAIFTPAVDRIRKNVGPVRTDSSYDPYTSIASQPNQSALQGSENLGSVVRLFEQVKRQAREQSAALDAHQKDLEEFCSSTKRRCVGLENKVRELRKWEEATRREVEELFAQRRKSEDFVDSFSRGEKTGGMRLVDLFDVITPWTPGDVLVRHRSSQPGPVEVDERPAVQCRKIGQRQREKERQNDQHKLHDDTEPLRESSPPSEYFTPSADYTELDPLDGDSQGSSSSSLWPSEPRVPPNQQGGILQLALAQNVDVDIEGYGDSDLDDLTSDVDVGTVVQRPEHEELFFTPDPAGVEGDEGEGEGEGEAANAISVTLVERAIAAERQVLGETAVLRDGEHAVPFVFRKKLGRLDYDIQGMGQGVDWSFLNLPGLTHRAEDELNEMRSLSIPSALSSGIESLPATPRSTRNVTHSAPTSRSRSVTSSRNGSSRSDSSPTSTPEKRTGVEEGEDEDQRERGQSVMTSASVRLRRARRGGSLIEDKLLAPSDGKRASGVKWPKYSENTIKARMSEIECDTLIVYDYVLRTSYSQCHGRVHYVCAGLEDNRDMRNEPWSCPECVAALEEQAREEEEEGEEGGQEREASAIPKAQRERCLRPRCVYLENMKIVRRHKDDDEFFLERIIGRRRIGRSFKGEFNYEYLVKWFDWDVYDSTWEPVHNLPNIEREIELFLHEAKRADIDLHWKYALLPETVMWFDDKGKYRIELLKELGVEERSWWYNDC